MSFFSKLSHMMMKLFLVVGAIAMMVMMVIVVGNSLGRALFNTPIFGTIEIAGLAGIVVVAVAVGFAERENRNVVVDVVANRFAPRTRAFSDAFTLFLSVAAVASLFWAMFDNALEAVTVREATLTTGVVTSPFKFTWLLGITILCLFLIRHMIEAIKKGVKR
jgi:TRAP-type C4-dicarboxylate transport system permease small subunit